MAGVSISDVGTLFTKYISGVAQTLNKESKARTMVRKGEKWTGDHIEGRVHVRRNAALGGTEDGGAIPVAGKQTYATYKAYRKFVVGSVQLTDGAMATGSGTTNVAIDTITSEVEGMMDGILKWENGMFFRNGTGSVAQLKDAAPSSTSFKVDDARMLWEGATYDVYTNSSGNPSALSGTVTIDAITEAPNADGTFQVTSTAALPTASTNDHLVWKNTVNRAPAGLDSLIDDATGTFQNVNTNTYPRYRSLVLTNSGTNRDLTPNLFRRMLAGLYQKTGSSKPASGLTVLTNSWQALNVEELYEGELRLTPETKTAGLAVASFQSALGKIDILTDSDATYHKMFFVDFDKIYRATQKELAWRRQGDSIFKRSDTSLVWTATCAEIYELYIKERHTSGKIEDLTEDPATAF